MSSRFESAARAWLASLLEASMTLETAIADLEAVARSYRADGHTDMADRLTSLTREVRARGVAVLAESEAARLILAEIPPSSDSGEQTGR
jgi:hypothetical protein